MAKKNPNIVFIFTDQQRADTMGYADDPVAITPHTDRLASEGVVFRRCCTNSPVCMPARASLITGRQVHQHGVWGFAIPDLRHGQSHVRNVRDAGYRTAVVGKTHLWPHGKGHTRDHVEGLRDWGYVDSVEATGPVETASTGSCYTDHLREKGLLDIHLEYLNTHLTGKRRHVAMPWELPPTNLPVEDHLDMFIAIQAEKWLDRYDHDEPFYLQVCFGGPHDPWDAPAEYRRLYDADAMSLSITDAPTGPVSPQVDMLLKGAPQKLDRMSEAENRVMKSHYYAKVTLIDDCVGRVVAALENRGWMDDTWIVFSSDHGEMLGDHGLMAKKIFYDGAVNVPCIFRPPGGGAGLTGGGAGWTGGRAGWTGGRAGWKSNALTDHLDIAATLLDIAGGDALEESYGSSLLSLIRAGKDAADAHRHKDAVLSELGLPPQAFSMLRTDRYKMAVHASTREPLDLYDMLEDPRELHNRVDDPALGEVREELIESELARLLPASS